MTASTITPAEFEKALARACMRAANAWMIIDPLRHGDKKAVLIGPHLRDIAHEAGISIPQARRRMKKLLEAGKVLRHDTSGGSTCWWLIGLAPRPQAPLGSVPAPLTVAPSTPVPIGRQPLTTSVAVPVRQHWSDVLGVPRDCSTSDARQAFTAALAAVPEHDLDAEQQRQRIRDAYNARLTEDGISEYE